MPVGLPLRKLLPFCRFLKSQPNDSHQSPATVLLSDGLLFSLPPQLENVIGDAPLERLRQRLSVCIWEFPDGQPTPKLTTNALSNLPSELAALEHLKVLNLSGNPLGQLPEIIFQLKSLTKLNAIAVNLSEIPESLGQIANLTQLRLDSNQITTIPECIGQLIELEKLDLENNQIGNRPVGIKPQVSPALVY
ncbi:hypothetical protein XM38_046490 [Halomicronema hongdechloris C2206]|uniref:Disease resistance R13L4/SHOC-2-like LRR domain-containing protein n=1 Tax=Halomicronema hongdechloris C2206 TaxID=1641165 RepID=A0A1Z3HU71_9CYAN|nr:hypothetical protein XM38_046490 [Halomicronema hongdechloris C2206]